LFTHFRGLEWVLFLVRSVAFWSRKHHVSTRIENDRMTAASDIRASQNFSARARLTSAYFG